RNVQTVFERSAQDDTDPDFGQATVGGGQQFQIRVLIVEQRAAGRQSGRVLPELALELAEEVHLLLAGPSLGQLHQTNQKGVLSRLEGATLSTAGGLETRARKL